MGAFRPRPLIFDAGALIAFERSDRRVLRLLELAETIHVPIAVVAQVWRNPARQVRLVRFLAADEVTVHPLDLAGGKAAGQLCGATGTPDIVDASVVLVAREHGGIVVTSDAGDLRRIDPRLELVEC